MKIAYITNSRFPSEKAQSDHVMAMCASFASLGHEVTVFSPDRKGTVADDPFDYYSKPRTFQFQRIPCVDTLQWRWLGSLGLWIQTATFIAALWWKLRQEKYDVIYSREIYSFLFRHPHAARIWEAHSWHTSVLAVRVMKSLSGIVALTQASAKRIREAGVVEPRIIVEPDAVDPALFQNPLPREVARQTLGIHSDEFLCLYTGKYTTMGMAKGLDEAIQAVKNLRRDGRRVRFLAVGGTEEERVRYAQYADEGVGFLGHQPQTDLQNFYAAADVLLMPFPHTEHFAYFMSPLKMFEYMMSGVPILATDLPSVREILDEKACLFAAPGDAASIQSKIAYAMDHPEYTRSLAAEAKERSGQYTWDQRAARILDWVKPGVSEKDETPFQKKRYLLVAGARPNFMKIAPLYRELQSRGASLFLVHTGQHYDDMMSDIFFKELGIPAPDANLAVGSGGRVAQTSKIMELLEPIIHRYNPDALIVVGDVNSTAAAAMAGVKAGVKVAHVEAGLRSFNWSMPEELNRMIADHHSDLLFVSDPKGLEHLQNERVPTERTHFVGNIMIDTLHHAGRQSNESTLLSDLSLESGGYALLTMHRPENVDEQESLRRLLDVLDNIGRYLPVVFPMHPRTQARIQEFSIDIPTNIQVIEPVGYIDMVALMKGAKCVLTDSGGLQEETTALGIPCLTLREQTERPITVEVGTSEVVGNDPDKILDAFERILRGEWKKGAVPDGWDGETAKRIVDVLMNT